MSDKSSSPARNPKHPRRSRGRRILKWTGIALGTLVALVIIAIVVIPHVVNLGPVKHEIEHVASRSTGRRVTIGGPLSLSLFPWVGFGAQDVTMANAPGFGDKPLMQVREADIHVQLVPLIFHEVKVSGITLDHMTLNLARDRSGVGNWRGIAGIGNTGAAAPGTGAPPARTNLGRLSIGHVAVDGLALNYDDAHSDRHYALSGIDLRASDISSGHAFPLQFRMVFNSRQPHVNLSFDLDTQVKYDAALAHIALDKGTLEAKLSGAGLEQAVDGDAQWREIALDMQSHNAEVKSLQLTAAGTTLHLDATVADLGKQPLVDGHLTVDPFSPRKVLATLGNPVPGNLQGFVHASLDTDMEFGANSATLDHLTLKLDDSTLSGRVSIPDLHKRALRFNLSLDTIDLNHYLPAGSGPAAHAATQHSQHFMETRLPGRLLSGLDMQGQLQIGRLAGFGLQAGAISLGLDAGGGTVRVDPLQASLYGGHYGGTVTLARAGQGVKLNTQQKLTGVEAGKLITALGGGSRLSGTANAALTLRGQGDTVAELLDTLKGSASLDLRHGAVDGINLWDSLERAYVLARDHKRLPASAPKRTEFASFKAHADIADGVITNDALEADLPFLAVTGHGHVSLVKHYVDYHLLAKVVKTPKTARANLARLKGLTVPVHVSGDFSDMNSAPDIGKALEARARAAVKKKLDAKKKSTEDKLKKKLQDLLGGGDGGGG